MAVTAQTSAWAPLRIRAFRALWVARLASNLGTWMQVDAPGPGTLFVIDALPSPP